MDFLKKKKKMENHEKSHFARPFYIMNKMAANINHTTLYYTTLIIHAYHKEHCFVFFHSLWNQQYWDYGTF